MTDKIDPKYITWALLLTSEAINHQDKTFRQLVDEKIIPSWAEFYLKKSSKQLTK